ncbi:hypothetical protein NicSoilB4_09970 [Arthrobacter sp. NicSoilB4]|nr:hypothetical protein NicSoilB4_09970 [Arthrobacter sp. NicSoilB4]
MALGQQHCQGQFGRFRLAIDHGVDCGQDALAGGAESLRIHGYRGLGRSPGTWASSHGRVFPDARALGEGFV